MSYLIQVPYLPKRYDPRRPLQRIMVVEQWLRLVKGAIGSKHQPLGFAEIRCVRASSQQMDYDNLVDFFRFALNALVRVGLILDDSPKHIQPSYNQIKAPKGAGYVLIEITEKKVA
jgi:hypothetical protein